MFFFVKAYFGGRDRSLEFRPCLLTPRDFSDAASIWINSISFNSAIVLQKTCQKAHAFRRGMKCYLLAPNPCHNWLNRLDYRWRCSACSVSQSRCCSFTTECWRFLREVLRVKHSTIGTSRSTIAWQRVFEMPVAGLYGPAPNRIRDLDSRWGSKNRNPTAFMRGRLKNPLRLSACSEEPVEHVGMLANLPDRRRRK